MSNIKYSFNGDIGYGQLPDGTTFIFDSEFFHKIKDVNFYRNSKNNPDRKTYIITSRGKKLHNFILEGVRGMVVDHINHDTFDNRLCHLRICTHQQNQCNQLLQKNNKSGVAGVSFYPPRNKYRARIKATHHDIHLGYYETFIEAVQARNVGMECMFGEYGVYNEVPEAPLWIREKVVDICNRFNDLSVCNKTAFAGTNKKAGDECA